MRRHGAAVANTVGHAALGYPPTWVTSGEEVLIVTQALNALNLKGTT